MTCKRISRHEYRGVRVIVINYGEAFLYLFKLKFEDDLIYCKSWRNCKGMIMLKKHEINKAIN